MYIYYDLMTIVSFIFLPNNDQSIFMKFFSSLFFLFLGISIYGQDSFVKGVVRSKVFNEGLISATVNAGVNGTYTDIDGTYELVLKPGEYTLEISYVGYETIVQDIQLQPDQTLVLDFELDESKTLLETATVTGSRYEQRLAEATVSIGVIKPDLIESNNAVSVDQILTKIPGVQIIEDQANIRGGSGFSYGAGSRVLLLIDDMPAMQTDAGLPQWNDVPIENISQVEVVKGAASALYGSSALNGIINVRTGYATSTPVTKASIHYTQFMSPTDIKKKWWDDTRFGLGGSLMHKQKFGKFDLVTGGFYYTLNSFNEFTEQNRGRLNLNTRYRISDRVSVGFNSFFTASDNSKFFLWRDGSRGAHQADPTTISESTNQRFILDPFITWYNEKGNKHRLQTRIYYINNDNNLAQSNSSTTYYGEYQYQHRITELDLLLTTGLIGQVTDAEAEFFNDSMFTSNNFATFLQLDKEIGERLTISAGTRYEYNKHVTPVEFLGTEIPDGKITESRLVSRFGLNYQVSDLSFFRASFGQGYRFPTLVERFLRTAFSGFLIFENPGLESETGWNGELGLKQGFNLFNFKGFLDVAAFWSEYSNMMEFTFVVMDAQPGFQSQNIGNTKIRGFEFSVGGEVNILNAPVTITGGYTYIDPKYKNFTEEIENSSSADFNILKYRTKHSFTIDIEGEIGPFNIGIASLGASHMEAIDNQLGIINNINLYRDANNDGFQVWDARLSYTYKNIKTTAKVNNIFNKEYSIRPALLEAPQNISLRVDFEF